MKKGWQYFLVVGSLVAGITFYNMNSASAYSHGAYQYTNYNVPAQTVQVADDQSTVPNNDNQQPYNQFAPNPYMMGPGMMWGNPNYGPNNSYPGMGWGCGMYYGGYGQW